MIVDAHVHIWPRWPYLPPVPDDHSRGSYQNLLAEMDRAGVDAAVAVNARIERSDDNNDYGAQAAAAFPNRLYQVADIDSRWSPQYHTPGAPGRLRSLIERYRPAGVSHYLGYENDGWLLSPEGDAFFSIAEESRMLVSLAAPPVWYDDLRVVARRHPGVSIMVNHLAVVMLHPGGVEEGLRLVLDREDIPNLLVKVSGYYYGSDRPWDYPYADRMWIAKAFYDNWGPGRMVWSSDWPSLLPNMSYRQGLEVLREHAGFLSADELDGVLGGNLERILRRNGRIS